MKKIIIMFSAVLMAVSIAGCKKSENAAQDKLPTVGIAKLLAHPALNSVEKGIQDVLNEFSPVVDYSGKAKLYFLSTDLSTPPKYSIKECKRRGVSYTVPLKVKTRFVVEETGEAIDQEVYLGDIPFMTKEGSFVTLCITTELSSELV